MLEKIAQDYKSNFNNSSSYYKYLSKVTPDNFDLIDVKKALYPKKIFIIYNPSAGIKLDKKSEIAQKMDENNIPYEMYTTIGFLDTMKIALNFEIDNYSAIVAVGGDGTCHEVVNGLMSRPDKKKLPICFLPNGSGNDLCGSLELNDFETGLNALVKGQIIKVDLFKILLDHENENTITGNKIDFMRYCIINSSLLLVGSSARKAVPLKPYVGKKTYTIIAIFEILRMFVGKYDIDIDNGQQILKDVETQYMQVYNGKFGGGRIMLNPLGLINDGYMELVFIKQLFGGLGWPVKALGMFHYAKNGGTHFYDNDFVCMRCKAIKLTNKTVDPQGKKVTQDINIDGEDLRFTNFAKWEILPSELEIIVDFDRIINKTY